MGHNFDYVTDILYDQYGQRTRIDYGNGTFTEYSYDPARRWLDSIKTENKWGQNFQNISYSFDAVGNVLGYENDCLDSVCGNYKTKQSYSYDSLYQLIKVSGETVYNPYRSSVPEFMSNYSQMFEFDSDGLGNMTSKVSTETVKPQKAIGDNLNYRFDYEYDGNFAHRLKRAGERYYKYDANGNVVCEQDGSFDGEEDVSYRKIKQETDNVYSTGYGWGLFKEDSGKGTAQAYRRTYTWNERNQLVSSVDANYATAYVYGQDGQRSNKYTQSSETLYFNKMWTLHTDRGNNIYGGQFAKNIYLGEMRIVTKLSSRNETTIHEEYYKQYYYHSDHLGSASLISDYKGDEYQRIEYAPYGETWVEKTNNTGSEYLPYKFTGKELDEETGLYYYGARYLDPKYSRWISTDPALGEYIPQAPISDEARKHNQNLPGMGGIFNHINCNLYHYAGNNPVRYIDPTGAFDWDTNTIEAGDTLSQIAQDCNTRYGTNYTADDLQGLNSDTISDVDKIYAGKHLNLGKAEDVQKRAADYTNRATTQYSNEQVSTLTNKTYQIGLGIGVFAVIAASFEVGICYSEKDGFDIYRTIGGGCGVGITGDITFSTNYSDFGAKSIHRSTGSTTQIGVGPLLNYAMPSGKFSGIGGIGVGGGTLWTYTRTVKGDIRDFVSLFRKKD